MNTKNTFLISAGHPCLEGHFPGNPVVPGVVILDRVRECIENAYSATDTVGGEYFVHTAKFFYPLLPEQIVEVKLNEDGNNKIRFKCLHDETELASGTFLRKVEESSE